MKILTIEFENINSLRGKHAIDFTKSPFTESPLFAITGPTGSGKSTILDVISLALFNQVPRIGKISKSEILSKGAILTRNQKEAWAKVTYQCKSGIYASQWSISTNRNDKLRDYEMEISEIETGKILDLKKSDVPSKNEALIGLNYNQFIKSVLLAQGEFSQFLKAKKEERGELLEKITGTGIYRQIGQMAFERFKSENLSIVNQLQTIATYNADLLDEEELKTNEDAFSEKDKHCKTIQLTIKKIEKQIELKQNIAKKEHEISEIAIKNKTLQTALEQFETQNGKLLKAHEKVQEISEDLRHWGRLKENEVSLNQEVQNLNTQKEKTSIEKQGTLKKIEDFIHTKVNLDSVETQISDFANKVRRLQEKKELKHSDYRSVFSSLTSETKDLDFSFSHTEDNLGALSKLKDVSEDKLKALKNSLSTIDLFKIEDERIRLKKEWIQVREAEKIADKLKQFLLEQSQRTEEITKLTSEKKGIPQTLKTAETTELLFAEKLEKLSLQKENDLLRASLEAHRSRLKDGQPCPLCGALHHPFAEHLPPLTSDIENSILEAQKEQKNWLKKVAELKERLSSLGTQIIELNQKQDKLVVVINSDKQKLKSISQDLKIESDPNWSEMAGCYETQIEKLDLYSTEKKHLTSIQRALPLVTKITLHVKEGQKIKQEIAAIYNGNDINLESQNLNSGWVKILQQQKHLEQNLKSVDVKNDENQKTLKLKESILWPHVRTHHFETIEEAQKVLLSDSEVMRIRNEKLLITAEKDKLNNSHELLTSQLNLAKKEDVEKALSILQEDLKTDADSLTKLEAECKEHDHRIKKHKDLLIQIEKLQAAIADKEKHIKRWRLLNELIGDSNGKKFNDFAQDLTLQQLLRLANIRLADLSDRYRMDKPTEEEDDGLVAIDDHMGGQRRSVKTLSGGETFVLSLSMALALSDLASNNVEINSLFIDEGFGTLDPETLDQTLDTLEKLQSESSKIIGIISHVDSLKERIATQIQLKRHGQGYSTLSIV